MTTPPTDLHGNETVHLIMFIALVAVIAGCCVWGVRRRDYLLPALLGGAALASFVEADLDVFSRIWWSANLPQAWSLQGITIPLVVPATYSLVIGGGSYLGYRLASQGRDILRIGIGICLAEAVFEMFFMKANIYDYWGPQPLEIFGFPLYWGAINGVGMMSSGVLVWAWRDRFAGSRAWLAVLVPPLAFGMDFAVAWPTWDAMAATSSVTIMSLASLVTIALCLGELWLAARYVSHHAPTRVAAERAERVAVA